MKISKSFILIFILAATAVAIAGLYSFYSRGIAQRDALLNSQKANQRTITKIEDEKRVAQSKLSELEASLKTAQAKLTEVRKSFPATVESIEYGEELARLVEDAKLKLVGISATVPAEEGSGSAVFMVVKIDVDVVGEVEKILAFLDSVSMGSSFRNASMQTLEIAGMDTKEAKARLTVTVRALKGS